MFVIKLVVSVFFNLLQLLYKVVTFLHTGKVSENKTKNTMAKLLCLSIFLYVFTLLTVPYVGVYLTYIAIPIIILLAAFYLFENDTVKKDKSEGQSRLIDGKSKGFKQYKDEIDQLLDKEYRKYGKK